MVKISVREMLCDNWFRPGIFGCDFQQTINHDFSKFHRDFHKNLGGRNFNTVTVNQLKRCENLIKLTKYIPSTWPSKYFCRLAFFYGPIYPQLHIKRQYSFLPATPWWKKMLVKKHVLLSIGWTKKNCDVRFDNVKMYWKNYASHNLSIDWIWISFLSFNILWVATLHVKVLNTLTTTNTVKMCSTRKSLT